ncbi:aminoacyl-tRNA hydrolase [Corynebacterium sp. A21]|uniref:aminoacyl-tRNA hydrolase n=1 Tax=Corynebacterium sp. A21 TaxID=3457318 RepID=UPI003FCF0C3A
MSAVLSFSDLIARLRGRRTGSPATAPLPELDPDWLIIGLGNPGAKYAPTRHNVGYMALDDLLAAEGTLLSPLPGSKAEVAQVEWEGQKVLLLRSTTFMNHSGQAIAPLCGKYGIAADHVVVIHDELDLPTGKVRVKLGGNENGHNGLKSTTAELDTREYLRVRIGISRPPQGMPVPDYVLSPIDPDAGLDTAISTAADAARLLVTQGLPRAQNTIHAR